MITECTVCERCGTWYKPKEEDNGICDKCNGIDVNENEVLE